MHVVYDVLGRKMSERTARGSVDSFYDAAGRRTMLRHPDTSPISYDRDYTGAVTAIRHWGATSGHGVLARYAYDSLGRRTSLTRGNGTVTTYTYDDATRLRELKHDLAGTAADQTTTFGYNVADQIVRSEATNGAYNWVQSLAVGHTYGINRLNQVATNNGAPLTYHPSGALQYDGHLEYSYDADNRLLGSSDRRGGSAAFTFDPVGRLQTAAAPGRRHFGYDGTELIAEYDDTGALTRRYVHGPGEDEPLAWYEGSSFDDVRWFVQDGLGSTVAVTDRWGGTTINTYDEYGVPGGGNVGLFQYTGQMWLREAGLYHYKARAYSPTLGRFLQPDPIGYGDGMNMYAYVGGDPVNGTDPTGLACTGTRIRNSSNCSDAQNAEGRRPESRPAVSPSNSQVRIHEVSDTELVSDEFVAQARAPVTYLGFEGFLGRGFGGQFGFGKYWVEGRDGRMYSGFYISAGVGIGLGAGAGVQVGSSDDLETFFGASTTMNLQYLVPPVSVSIPLYPKRDGVALGVGVGKGGVITFSGTGPIGRPKSVD